MKKTLPRVICIILIFITVIFIFYNSAQPVKKSSETSSNVAQSISPIEKEEYETPKDWRIFVNLVRKGAHVAEFFVLGTEVSVLVLFLYGKRTIQALLNMSSFCLAVAVADESIQILSKRGPLVQDVLLDFFSAETVILFCFLICLLSDLIYRKYKAQKQ